MNRKLNQLSKCLPILLFLSGIILLSCNRHPSSFKDEETPTSGKVKIAVDESYKLLIDTETFTFQSIYKDAHIQIMYKTEQEVLKDFLNDSVRFMITSRKLTKNEDEYLRSKQLVPRTDTIAYDGLALIVNNHNPDSLIRFNDVKNIFLGKSSNWKQINPKSPSQNIKVVFDSEKSSNVRYFVEKFNLPNKLPNYCYAVNSNEEVINYVEGHQNAIGIISVNWVSDKNDSLSNTFLKRIKVVAVSSELNSEGDDFYRPYQAYIADKSYPFIRKVYFVSRETYTGLGEGFMHFVAGQVGQRIILKSKLVPATMPVRLIHLKKNNIE